MNRGRREGGLGEAPASPLTAGAGAMLESVPGTGGKERLHPATADYGSRDTQGPGPGGSVGVARGPWLGQGSCVWEVELLVERHAS